MLLLLLMLNCWSGFEFLLLSEQNSVREASISRTDDTAIHATLSDSPHTEILTKISDISNAYYCSYCEDEEVSKDPSKNVSDSNEAFCQW